MSVPPPLGPRALASYRRLRTEVDALNTVLVARKPAGAIGPASNRALDSVRHRANKLFCRHAELPWFPWLTEETISQADFAILVARFTAALRQFEALHAGQLGLRPDEDDDFEDDFDALWGDDVPSPRP